MRSMKRIADTGRTICATIHQPSAAVFDMFVSIFFMQMEIMLEIQLTFVAITGRSSLLEKGWEAYVFWRSW